MKANKQKQMKGLRTWKAMLVLLCISWVSMGFLQAQERATTVDWSGPVSGRTFTTNTDVYLTGDVTLNGKILVRAGVELNIYAKGADRKITRGNFTGQMFYTYAGSSTVAGGSLSFNADNRDYTITIDGGAEFEDDDAKKTLLNEPPTGKIIVAGGSLTMHHVIIQNGNIGATGAISFQSGQSMPNGSAYPVHIEDVTIRAIKGGGVVHFTAEDHHTFGDNDFLRVEIYNCSSFTNNNNEGATIRSVGGAKSNLVLNACEIHHNEAALGGAVLWNASAPNCTLKVSMKFRRHKHQHL